MAVWCSAACWVKLQQAILQGSLICAPRNNQCNQEKAMGDSSRPPSEKYRGTCLLGVGLVKRGVLPTGGLYERHLQKTTKLCTACTLLSTALISSGHHKYCQEQIVIYHEGPQSPCCKRLWNTGGLSLILLVKGTGIERVS